MKHPRKFLDRRRAEEESLNQQRAQWRHGIDYSDLSFRQRQLLGTTPSYSQADGGARSSSSRDASGHMPYSY